MDKGRPFRMPSSADAPKRSAPAPASAQKPVADSAPAAPSVVPPVSPAAKSSVPSVKRDEKQKPGSRRWLVVVLVLIVLAAIAAVGWLVWNQSNSLSPAVDTNKFQAVSTVDGQVYFGKLSSAGSGFIKVSDAYYLQAQASTDTTPSDTTPDAKLAQDSVKLIKLSNKVYGPDDTIIIASDKVLSYENLDPNGQVGKWLKQRSQ